MIELSYRDPAALSYGFAALAFLAFSMHLGLGWRAGLRASILMATIVVSVLWAGVSFAFAITRESAVWSGQTLLDALRVGGWLLFLVTLIAQRPDTASGATHTVPLPARGSSPRAQDSTPLRGIKWFVAAILLLPVAAWFYPPAPPVSEPASLLTHPRLPYAFLLGLSVTGLVLAEQIFRRALEQARWSIKPLCIGLGAGFVFDLYMYADALLLSRMDPDVWAARGLVQAMVIPFIALATARNKDWTIDIALSRRMMFHSTAFLASGIYLLTVAAAGYYVRYFGGTWGKTFQVGFIFAALMVLVWLFFSGTLRSRLRVFINKNFFSYRYDYREEWLRFTNLLSVRDPHFSAPQRCIQALANLVESPAGGLWLLDERDSYSQAARWNLPATQVFEGDGQSLLHFLRTTGWVVNIDEYLAQPSRYPNLEIPEWLRSVPSAWLIVPILAQDELIGFVILSTPRAKIEVNWEVRDLLKTAARQLGSFLREVKSSEALLEARQFQAFNKMAAFVVHDLKNLVAQLSLLLTNAERHRHNPKFQDDALSTVRNVSERMNKLLRQLSSGARNEAALHPINLGSVAERVIDAKRGQRNDIELAKSEAIMALGHEQRFERVIGHLIQNAIDATHDGGSVAVQVFSDKEHACIEVIDTGCGMSEAFLRDKLFRPFETTKGTGMGIGAYETAQYVKETGGRIEARSTPGSGTRIRVILPLYREAASRDQQDREVA